jgi:hypothetical protein
VGDRSLGRFATPADFPIVARTHMYTYAAKVWDLYIVLWPFSVAACRTLHRSIRNFFVAIKGGALHRVAGERRDGQGDVYSTTSTVFLQPRQVSQEVYPQVSLANPPHAGSS